MTGSIPWLSEPTAPLPSLAFLFAMVPALFPAARAATTAEFMAEWDLLGTWAQDCYLPPSEANGHYSYLVVQTGRAAHERDWGTRLDVGDVLKAELAVGGIGLEIHFLQFSQTREVVIAKAADGRTRVLSERIMSTNEFVVSDGKFIASGAHTPWQTRCR